MNLSDLVSGYVRLKQAMGMCYRSEAGILRSFCKSFEGEIDITQLDPSAVEVFLSGKGPVTSFWYLKYKVLNGFFRFAIERGYIDSSPLPERLPKHPQPQMPHIYTLEELRKLLDATDLLGSRMSMLQAATFRTLLLTLYGTGIRISEALSLPIADADLRESVLIIRDSKFFKTRLVPVGPGLTEHLRSYLEKRNRLRRPSGPSSAFFATRTGNHLSYHRASKIFRLLRKMAGIHRKDGVLYAPRIHDIRHTFAVHRLEAWYREGADVQRMLPRLSTYLGHVDVAETQHYLTMTPELLREANRRFELYAVSEVLHA